MKSLGRSEKYKMIGGVAGGLAEYFDIDPLIPRILFIISLFWNGGGILVYIILWIILPVKSSVSHEAGNEEHSGRVYEDAVTESTREQSENAPQSAEPEVRETSGATKTNLIAGLVLIFLGLLFLLDQLLPVFYFQHFWPLALIFVGIALLISGLKEKA